MLERYVMTLSRYRIGGNGSSVKKPPPAFLFCEGEKRGHHGSAFLLDIPYIVCLILYQNVATTATMESQTPLGKPSTRVSNLYSSQVAEFNFQSSKEFLASLSRATRRLKSQPWRCIRKKDQIRSLFSLDGPDQPFRIPLVRLYLRPCFRPICQVK